MILGRMGISRSKFMMMESRTESKWSTLKRYCSKLSFKTGEDKAEGASEIAEEMGETIWGGITKVDGRLEGGDDSFSVVPFFPKQQSEHLKLKDLLTRL